VALVVGVATAYSFVRWKKPFRVEINGSSMSPTLLPGDWALAVSPGRLRRGDVVVVEHPERPGVELVKRLTGLPDDLAPDGRILKADEYWVEGDDLSRSTDSRHFGPVARERLKAKVRLVYWPPSRRRLL
jgi:nickel-type superoxide dismutase maturation protease